MSGQNRIIRYRNLQSTGALPNRVIVPSLFLIIILLARSAVPVEAAPAARSVQTLSHPMVRAIAFAPDGKTLCSVGGDSESKGGEIRVWDVRTGRRLHLFPHNAAVLSVAYSPDGKHRATGDSKGIIHICDASSGKLEHPLASLAGDPLDYSGLAWSPRGDIFAAVGFFLKAWKTSNYRPLYDLAAADECGGFSLRFSPAGCRIATCGGEVEGDGCVTIWDTNSGHKLHSVLVLGWVYDIAFAVDGATLASSADKPHTEYHGQPIEAYMDGNPRGEIDFWDVQTGKLRRSIGCSSSFQSVAYSPDGKLLVGGTKNGTIRIYSAHTLKLLRVLTDQGGPVTSLAFSPDGSSLASAAGDFVRLRALSD